MFATEVMDGRVSARSPGGEIRVIAANLPGANGIAIHSDRIFVDEFRPGGRLLEVYATAERHELLWTMHRCRMPFARDLTDSCTTLRSPPAKFGAFIRIAAGRNSFASDWSMRRGEVRPKRECSRYPGGQRKVSRISLSTRALTDIAQVRPGLDNCAYDAQGRLFVSHFVDGGISEILGDGQEREVSAPGLLGPWGLDVDGEGVLYVADGMSMLALMGPDRLARRVATFATGGFPGFLRTSW